MAQRHFFGPWPFSQAHSVWKRLPSTTPGLNTAKVSAPPVPCGTQSTTLSPDPAWLYGRSSIIDLHRFNMI